MLAIRRYQFTTSSGVHDRRCLECARVVALEPVCIGLIGAGHEQFATQSAADFEFVALDETVNAEIIDTEQVCGFLDGIGQPFRVRGGRWCFRCGNGLHISSSWISVQSAD